MNAAEDIFLTSDRAQAVPAGHPDARFLLARAGAEIPAAAANAFNISDGKPPTPDMSAPRNQVPAEGESARRGPGRPKTRDA